MNGVAAFVQTPREGATTKAASGYFFLTYIHLMRCQGFMTDDDIISYDYCPPGFRGLRGLCLGLGCL